MTLARDIGKMLHQGSPESHVEHLGSSTDPEDRQSLVHGVSNECELS